MYRYKTVYYKSGNIWVAKYTNEGYISWKLLDCTEFYEAGNPRESYYECNNEEYSLDYRCSHQEFLNNIW
jgi:hypothetical protein